MKSKDITRILFIDDDETSFQFRKCMAQVLQQLPPMELFHAQDATEGLRMLDKVKPNVIVIDDELKEECDLFLESLSFDHPPIVLHFDGPQKAREDKKHLQVTYLRKNESLAGIHDTLLAVTSIAAKAEEVTHQ